MPIPFVDLVGLHSEFSDELDEVWKTIGASSNFIGGKHVENFEAEWAAYCDADYCVGVDSGTSAIELALRGLGIGLGDEVIVPAFTFIGTAEAVAAVGARVVFADVNAATLLMGADEIRQVMSARTAAVIVVHLYGQPADMDAISSLARAAHIAVVEDAAQAHGAKWRGRPVGSCSNAACFSFYPTKNLGAFGDAGAVVTNDSALAERIRLLSNHGRPPQSDDLHELVGGTHRLDALQAAVLSVKLKRLDSWNAARARAAHRYTELLSSLPLHPVGTAEGACSSHHCFVIESAHRNIIKQKLAMQGIASKIFYRIPCHRQNAFLAQNTPFLPVSENAANRVLALPLFPNMSEEQIELIAGEVHHALTLSCEALSPN
jgi:dTDP-4-amino-4,6-dideoxygalactose transaminase